jgi:RNA polymerase sigma-54 factor
LLAEQEPRHILGFMAAGLEQYQGLHLQQTLSPQMQQSLFVLQAPLLELRQLVSRELVENPVLEEESSGVRESLEMVNPEVGAGEPQGGLAEAWEPMWEQQRLSTPSEANERHQFLMDSLTRTQTLGEAVRGQVVFFDWTVEEAPVVEAIVGNLGPNGYLEAKEEEIAARLRCTPLQVEEVLVRVQDLLEPAGLAARDLADCLLIQLRRKGLGESLAARLVSGFLPQLARRKLGQIAKTLQVPLDEVQEAVEVISQLDPSPAREFESEPNPLITPEVFVEKEGDDFVVRLNRDELPSLRISNDYKDMLGQNGTVPKEAKEYLREKIRAARYFLRSLEQRGETILAIAREIVIRQREFMEQGPGHLRPMTMSVVAEAVGVHETTVSRAVSGKFMSTPHGVYEMKYFFTAGYTTASGEEISNETVRQSILALVDGEDPRKPWSDEQMVQHLAEQGIKVARRTIAKYRDQLNILPSHLRKR